MKLNRMKMKVVKKTREAMEHRIAFVSTKAMRRPQACHLHAEDLER